MISSVSEGGTGEKADELIGMGYKRERGEAEGEEDKSGIFFHTITGLFSSLQEF